MRFLILLGCLYFSLANSIKELNDLNFQETIDNNSIVMILFYSPWCATCKKAKSEFDALANLVDSFRKPYVIARIDGSAQTEVADKVEIMNFPLVLLYVDKKKINYEKKELIADEMLRFIDKTIRPPSVELMEKEEIEATKNVKGTICLLITGDDSTKQAYIEVAKTLKDIPFYHITEEKGKVYFPEVKKVPAVMLFADEHYVLDSNLTKEEITKFIELNRFPTLNYYNKDVGGQLLKFQSKVGVLFFVKDKDPNLTKYTEEFRKVAEKYRAADKLFVIAKLDNELAIKLLKHLNYEETKAPFIVIMKRDFMIAKYDYKGEFVAEKIGQFVEDFEAGKLEESVKSEEVPEENKGPVYKIVGKTFEKEVIKSDVDVFVKFYAPWCGHCKTLAPIYEELAEMLKEGNKLKLVEMDATVNEARGFIISSYPTLKLFTRKQKENPIEYSGGRNIKEMLEFIKENYDGELIIKDIKTNTSNTPDDNSQCDSDCKDKPK